MKNATSKTACSLSENEKTFPDTLPNNGSNNCVMAMAKTKAINAITIDSPRNCLISDCLSAPNTFLTPTSAERLEDLAVDKFMKLIHAINKVNNATEPKMYKYV